MYRLYSDIRDKLGEPLWHDEHGVPRYCEFHPEHCGIYDRHVALLEIECQSCGQRFPVSASWDHGDAIQAWVSAGKPQGFKWEDALELPTPTNHGGSFTFGDAPWHGERQCAGTTMTTDTIRVLQFWSRDGGEHGFDWRRRPEFEVSYEALLTE